MKKNSCSIITTVLILCFTHAVGFAQEENTPNHALYSEVSEKITSEISGIVKSHLNDNVYWVHGDSGNRAALYAINIDGNPADSTNYIFEIPDLLNLDWEDLSITHEGTLIIADIGNNCRCRQNLSLIFVNESNLRDSDKEKLNYVSYQIHYPDTEKFLGIFRGKSPNAEAIFTHPKGIYIITKDDKGVSGLYRVPDLMKNSSNELRHIKDYDFDGQVTGADYNNDLQSLAVLTYNGIWLIKNIENPENNFPGEDIWYLPIRAGQVEAITFVNPEKILLISETGKIYTYSINDFKKME